MRFEGEEAPEQRYARVEEEFDEVASFFAISIFFYHMTRLFLHPCSITLLGLLEQLLVLKMLIQRGGKILNGDASR